VDVHSERRRSIILWGPPGSGKSLYLTSLVRWLSRERDERAYTVLPANDATARWIAGRAAPHPEGFALLPNTGRPAEPPHFRLYSISDAAGGGHRRSELVADLTLSDASPGERAPAGLATASGVMLFLPVATMALSADARDECVSWLTTTLARLPEEAGQTPPAVSLPVAVCLTQTDEVPDAVRRDANQWLESFGSETVRALRAHCARYSVFKVSSLGRAPRRRDGIEVVIGTPEPRGALSAIRWILETSLAEVVA
jgi:GTPase SAR1 family protein